MVPAEFEYLRPASVDEAIGLLSRYGQDAKILAGGHSLIPAMKLRLAQPKILIDLGRLKDLRYIAERKGMLVIGAMSTHADVGGSGLLGKKCPLFVEAAQHIGDLQVRNRGTIGGSLVHADPGADWPAVVLALDAELEIAGPNGRRTVGAADFFVDMYQTALGPSEILVEIRSVPTPSSVAYAKTSHPASGFAVVGVAATADAAKRRVRVGITGVAPKAYRAGGVERALEGRRLDAAAIAGAAAHAADNVEPLSDLHASAEFRAHLARVQTARALTSAGGRK